jgi:hypothetical protein
VGDDFEQTRVLRSGLPVRITDYQRVPGPVARLAWGLGAVWGATWVNSKQPEPFPHDTESRPRGFAELVATAISKTVSRAQLAASRARRLPWGAWRPGGWDAVLFGLPVPTSRI